MTCYSGDSRARCRHYYHHPNIELTVTAMAGFFAVVIPYMLEEATLHATLNPNLGYLVVWVLDMFLPGDLGTLSKTSTTV